MTNKTNIEKYIQRLKECQNMDQERAHVYADEVLEEVILKELGNNFKQVVDEYRKIPKWYS